MTPGYAARRAFGGVEQAKEHQLMDQDSAAEHLRLQAEVAELEPEHRTLTKQRPPNMTDHAEHMRKLRDLHSRLEAHPRRLRGVK